MPKIIKVLSLDGGGIRGIIPALLLAEIERQTQKPISGLFDLVAGTSTGGILALGLTKPNENGTPEYKATDIVKLYENDGSKIFSRDWFHKAFALNGLNEEKYSSKGIESVLDSYFGSSKLEDVLTEVLITSYEIERRTAWFFKSSKAKKDPEYNFFLKDIARSTSAAPTYFEPYKLNLSNSTDYYALIDGGVYANNPAMCAYVEAKTLFPDADEILLVSLGTGVRENRIPYNKAKSWGLTKWAKPILSVVFDGIDSTVDYQLSKLLDSTNNYYRFQAYLEDVSEEMDNTKTENLRDLKLLGERLISDNYKQLTGLCSRLIQ